MICRRESSLSFNSHSDSGTHSEQSFNKVRTNTNKMVLTQGSFQPTETNTAGSNVSTPGNKDHECTYFQPICN